jgi:FixJ family two-component response regulator
VVVIVDDDASIRRAITRSLNSHAIRVEAFPSAEQYLNSERMPDTACLILDVMLPGMKGLDLRQWFKENGRHIPIIFITAQNDDHVREQALEQGAVAVLRKPFQEPELTDAIAIAHDTRSARMSASAQGRACREGVRGH